MVHRSGYSFKFSIFRKPTNVSSYIHYYSNHSDNVKHSVFSSMFLRALRICSPEFIDAEFKKVYDIAFSLKYPKYFIDIALRRARKTFYSDDKKIFDCKNILALPFQKDFINIPKLLKNFNVNVVFKNPNTIKNLLIKHSPDIYRGCIYRIPCKDCEKCYVGQTAKEISLRRQQHRYDVRIGKTSNALFVHIMNCDHQIDWNNARQLLKCSDLINRNIIESCIIKVNWDNLMNLSPGMYKLDNFIVKKIIGGFEAILNL